MPLNPSPTLRFPDVDPPFEGHIMFAEYCFACRHVLDQLRPVLYVSRDHGDWIFACGHGDHGGIEDWGRAHTRHFLESDATIKTLADLGPRDQAARYRLRSEWLRLPG